MSGACPNKGSCLTGVVTIGGNVTTPSNSQLIGILFNSESYGSSLPANSITDSTFYNYNNPCRSGSALQISFNEQGGNIIPNMESRNMVRGLSFKNSPRSILPFAPTVLGTSFMLGSNITRGKKKKKKKEKCHTFPFVKAIYPSCGFLTYFYQMSKSQYLVVFQLPYNLSLLVSW